MSRSRISAGTTRQHRGLRSYIWTWGDTLSSLLLLLLVWAVVWMGYDPVQGLWREMLSWGWPRLGIGDANAVGIGHVTLFGQAWDVVSVDIATHAPDAWQRWATLGVVLLLFLASVLLPRHQLPWIYGLRVLAFLGGISLAAAVFLPGLPEVDVRGYFNDLLKIGAIFLWLVPLLHALLLYIFPLHWLSKLWATAVALLFVVISVPLQVGAMGWVLVHSSSLMILPLYLLATFLPALIAQLGIYAYFVSWSRVAERRNLPRHRLDAVPLAGRAG